MHVTLMSDAATFDARVPAARYFLAKYWPDQPYLIISGVGEWSDVGISWFGSGVNINMAPMTLLLLDDYLLSERPQVEKIQRAWDWMACNPEVGCVRLNPEPGPDLRYERFPELGQFDNSQEYLVSLQPSIWRLLCLAEIARPGESAWQYELSGTVRARELHWKFLGAREHWIPIKNLYHSWGVDPEVVEWAAREGFPAAQ